jgi:hypothetical protein
MLPHHSFKAASSSCKGRTADKGLMVCAACAVESVYEAAHEGFAEARRVLAVMAQQAHEAGDPRGEQRAELCQALLRVAAQNMIAVKVGRRRHAARSVHELFQDDSFPAMAGLLPCFMGSISAAVRCWRSMTHRRGPGVLSPQDSDCSHSSCFLSAVLTCC